MKELNNGVPCKKVYVVLPDPAIPPENMQITYLNVVKLARTVVCPTDTSR